MKNAYREYKFLNLTNIADEIRKFWEDNDIFNKSLQRLSELIPNSRNELFLYLVLFQVGPVDGQRLLVVRLAE